MYWQKLSIINKKAYPFPKICFTNKLLNQELNYESLFALIGSNWLILLGTLGL